MKIKLYLLLFLFSINIFSQRETDHWYFGDKAGIHFNKGNVDVLEDSQMTVINGSSSISDSQGNLLFYTDGQTIWNKNHEIMINGEGLNGELNNTQSSIIIPKPNSDTTFYVFTTRKTELSSPLVYPMIYHSEIEFSTSRPLGWVKYKNMPLMHSTANKITAIHHKNGKDVWGITYGSNAYEAENDILYAIKVTEDGVERPFTTTQLEYVKYENSYDGEMTISPDGSTIALYNAGLIRFFEFDTTTGLFSKIKYVTIAEFGGAGYDAYGLTFSPDSKLLYYSARYSNRNGQSYNIMQLEVDNPDEGFRGTPVYSGPLEISKSSISLGTDGKIYIAQSTTENIFDGNGNYLGFETYAEETLSIVHEPNRVGQNADYEHEAINLKSGASYKGLPNFIQSYFRNRIITENKCITDVFNFSLDSYNTITAAKWDFGDGNSGTGLTADHQYTTSGNFIVTCLVTIEGKEIPFYKEITVYPLPKLTSDQKLIQCDGDNNGIDLFDLTDIGPKIVEDSFNKAYLFYKSSNDAERDENRIPNPKTFENESTSQELFVKVITEKGCGSITNFFIESKFVSLGDVDTYYTCDSSDNLNGDRIGYFDLKTKSNEIRTNFNLDAENTIRFYPTLLDAQTTENQLPNKFNSLSTTIYVRVDNELGCGGMEPVNLVVNPTPKIELQDSYTICFNPNVNPITLTADASNDAYEWRNSSDNIISTNKDFKLNAIGDYSLTVYKTENGITCTSFKEFTVINPPSATFYDINVNTEDETNNIVDINLNGNSTYEFSLDNNTFFGNGTSHTFTNVTPGLRTIYIRDINNCEPPVQTDVSVIGYRKFFTPNNDNKNDYWNVKGIDSAFFKSVKIFIMDRYGKVVYQITDFNNLGWDGTYNGKPLPSNDYWFHSEIIDNNDQLIKASGNFSLIRK
ncbi:T9SS type B sorting domain-containing protein [Polaribacter atrinae]|uniref:T9SS type B sorting domain-containing protein n=1 Tax=Polaribacter atrinae TaxID=1333662 RepID=UPI0024904F2B|nr:T9SS type B sorting domain-containing protein [Polaribacter atrinae]